MLSTRGAVLAVGAACRGGGRPRLRRRGVRLPGHRRWPSCSSSGPSSVWSRQRVTRRALHLVVTRPASPRSPPDSPPSVELTVTNGGRRRFPRCSSRTPATTGRCRTRAWARARSPVPDRGPVGPASAGRSTRGFTRLRRAVVDGMARQPRGRAADASDRARDRRSVARGPARPRPRARRRGHVVDPGPHARPRPAHPVGRSACGARTPSASWPGGSRWLLPPM